ncbi:MAG: nuclear transport factor 2 family protein, partial [Solirubrobacterales bacterium]
NAEIVTRSFEGFDDADMEKFTSDWAPDIVFDTSNYEFWPFDQTEFHGPEEVVFIFGQFMSNVRSLEVHDLRVTEIDDRHIFVTYDELRRNQGEADPVELKIGTVYELREGRIAHVWVFTDQARAEAFSREVSG